MQFGDYWEKHLDSMLLSEALFELNQYDLSIDY